MSDALVEAYLGALKSMRDGRPRPLAPIAVAFADDPDGSVDLSAPQLVKRLCAADANDELLRQLGLALFNWDDQPATEPWTVATQPHSPERRARAHELLGLDATAAECVDRHFPPVRDTSVIISREFKAWYPPPGLESRPLLGAVQEAPGRSEAVES